MDDAMPIIAKEFGITENKPALAVKACCPMTWAKTNFSDKTRSLDRNFRLAVILLLSVFCLAGCKQQPPSGNVEITPSEITTFVSGNLGLRKPSDVPATLYIDAHNDSGAPLRIPEKLARNMGDDHFRIVHSPSDAGYILHIAILHEGAASEADMQRLVNAGYDSRVQVSGGSCQGLLADALLVLRRVPEARKEHMAHLKNVSTRNALENAQMRIGLLDCKNASGQDQEMLIGKLSQTLRQELSKTTTAP